MIKQTTGKLNFYPKNSQERAVLAEFYSLNDIWFIEKPKVFSDHYYWCGGDGR